ncbi:MAG: CoA transferase [Pseudomonadota bacterium]
MSRPAPLSGIRIVDLTQVFAGPYCTYQLALLGAHVIKVEPPGGELTRAGGAIPELNEAGLGLSFCTQNSDKQCITVDLKDPVGRDAVLDLAADVDIFIQNYRPGVAERLGLGEAALRARNPNVIYCSISAYGSDGPIGHRPAYDHVVQAMSGIMATTGTQESGPTKVGAPYVDYGTGMNAAFAILAALRERDRTGEGQSIDVSMLDTTLLLMANNVVTTATTGQDLPPLGNEAASRAPSSGCFIAADGGMLMLAANNERQFRDLCAVAGHAEWADDPRWSAPAVRRENQDALRAVLDTAFATKTAAEWETLLDAAGVPASRTRRLSETIAEGQPDARGLLHEVAVGGNKTPVKLTGIGFRLNGDPLAPQDRPHAAGEDNERWLG